MVATSLGIFVTQANNIIIDRDHQNGHKDGLVLPRVCIFITGSNVLVLEYAHDLYQGVRMKKMIQDFSGDA